jgi:hypothetical protein
MDRRVERLEPGHPPFKGCLPLRVFGPAMHRRVSLIRPEYEAMRAVSVRFAIALDHENPEIDRVVSEDQRFATVDKFYGFGARIARASDPRR